jgi:hypothetical protein
MGFAHRDDLDPSALRWDPACEIEEMKVDEAILLP